MEDFYFGRLDGYAANEVLKVRRIRSRYRIAFNRNMLCRAIAQAATFDAHLSCHGDKAGIQLTDGDCLTWNEVAEDFEPLASPDRILVNSTCVGGDAGIATAFGDAKKRFGYLCGSLDANGVAFHDSCIAWSILYNVLANHEDISRKAFQDALRKINLAVSGDFVYRRWDRRGRIYRSFPPAKKTACVVRPGP
jgi:hypothetical protein